MHFSLWRWVALAACGPALVAALAAAVCTQEPSENAGQPEPPAVLPAVAADAAPLEPGEPAVPAAAPVESLPEEDGIEGATNPLRAPDAPPSEARPAEAADPKPTVEAVSFDGVQPGVSTIDEVAGIWGNPLGITEEDGVVHHTYAKEPFEQIQVTFASGKVRTIAIDLHERFPPQVVAEQLELSGFEPVLLPDESGRWVGQAYPERGVVFRLAPSGKPAAGGKSRPVTRIVLGMLDPRPFVLRAEARLSGDYAGCLEDVAQALAMEKRYGRAHWLRARVLAGMGRHDEALQSADRALGLEPDNPEYRLTRAQILAAAQRWEEAVGETQAAIEACASRPELEARGVSQLGDQLGAGPQHDYQRAIELHLRAIRIAEPLAGDRRASVRRAAKQVLIEAHLGAAQDIARGYWKTKAQVVPKWLHRARTLAEETIENDGIPAEYRLHVCRQALAACVGLEGRLDPSEWVQRALDSGRREIDASADPLYQGRVEWLVGQTLADAAHAYHQRGQHRAALQYGKLAAAFLERSSTGRQLVPGDAYQLGRLYFLVGSIHAVDRGEHDEAVRWFDKALPLVRQPHGPSALAEKGRQGETCVSMAVSYWSLGDHEQALRLTSEGAKWMEEAVRDGTLAEKALAVAYSNLATMHRHLGDEDDARHFGGMAARIDPERSRR